METLGEKIKGAREDAGLTQDELAKQLHVDKNTVWRWENNERHPHYRKLQKIASVLEIDLRELISGEDESNIDEIIFPKGGFIKVPLIDMNICAGNGWNLDFVDTEEIISVELLPAEWAGRIDEERKPFMVLIKGDSMSDADLPNGFHAIINPAEDVHSGDSAMVRYGEDKTVALKRVYFMPDGAIELRSASPGYPVITYSREQQLSEYAPLVIIGKVMGVHGWPKRG